MDKRQSAVHFSKNRRGIEKGSNDAAKAINMMPLMGMRKKLAIVLLLLVVGAAAAFGFVPSEDQAARTGLILQKQTKEGGELSLFSSLPSVEKKSATERNTEVAWSIRRIAVGVTAENWCPDPAESPAVPGCVSQGDTLDEARGNIREAIAACLEVRAERDLPLTVETRQVEVADFKWI